MSFRFIILVVYVLAASLPLVEIAFGQLDDEDVVKVTEHCGLYAYRARVTEVYDGDTITADIDLGFKVWRHDEKLRLFGIDAPEMRGEERPEGEVARDALRERILGREVVICTIRDKTGKYGRYLAEIFAGGENINAWLMERGYAKPYADAGYTVRKSSMLALGLAAEDKRFERTALE